jgi:pimeloyl-ACP methyl ester carboxylesterase
VSTLDAILGRPNPQRHERPLEAPDPGAPPSMRGLAGEAKTGLQLARLVRAAPWLAFAPRGDGRTVIDLPGWRAPEISNAPLRTYLRLLGYRARPWGLGTNTGNPERNTKLLVDLLRRETEPVGLVGWSLGGVVAREIAREVPEHVACVVTFGSPIIGGPSHTVTAQNFDERELRRIRNLVDERDRTRPLGVPVTAIYTKDDRIVDWRACIDRRTEGVEHIEVRSTHLGLGVDPDVWWAVARALPHGRWNRRS